MLAAVVKHTGAGFSFRLKSKAVDAVAVAACVRFMYEQGLRDTIKLKTDPENAIMSFAKAIAKARQPAPTIPLTTAVGSWKSNRAVERYIHKLGTIAEPSSMWRRADLATSRASRMLSSRGW